MWKWPLLHLQSYFNPMIFFLLLLNDKWISYQTRLVLFRSASCFNCSLQHWWVTSTTGIQTQTVWARYTYGFKMHFMFFLMDCILNSLDSVPSINCCHKLTTKYQCCCCCKLSVENFRMLHVYSNCLDIFYCLCTHIKGGIEYHT